MKTTITKLSLLMAPLLVLSGCNINDSQSQTTQQVTQGSMSQLQANIKAPVAKKVSHPMEIHGHKRNDHYYWMRDDERKDPEILAHLEAENTYTKQMLAHTESLQAQLFEEIKSRIQKDDSSVPVKHGGYYYSSEASGDSEYSNHVRADDFKGTNKTILLNVNEMAQGHEYYAISGTTISPNDQLLAYGEDTVSRRIYTLKFKDLSTGKLLNDELKGTSGNIVWGNDNKTVYYIKKDPQTLLGYQVFRHTLGTSQSKDELIYEETDLSFYTYLAKSKDGSTIYIYHDSTESSAVSLVDANNPKAMPQPLLAREKSHEYSVEKLGEWFYINTNWQAVNFRLMKVHQDKLNDKSQWQTVIPANDNAKLDDFTLFDDHLVYEQREDGLTRVTVRQLSTGKEHKLSFNDPAFRLSMYGNNQHDASTLRLYYSSMTTPASHYDYALTSDDRTLLKQTKVLGDFNPDNYQSERISITARDGAKVPVSIVYRKDKFKQDGTNPLLQYGYGSYGTTIDPSFSSARLSLLDRGFVYAIAHVRGSQMLGRPWYDDGKKLTKMNTFNDFIDVTKGLVAQGYGDEKNIFASGGSAGGLLMGTVINIAPELYNGIAASVPFVDVVTTMLDESIPLTTNEFDEWGNPKNKAYYDYMLAYSPYDQVKAQDYPNILITTGLHDSQVQYFEPMKWVAKLREFKTDDNVLVFKTDMESGHGGASGRFKRIHKAALQYSFFLDLVKK
ncbi:S9 family peptidase [Psychrobium sp. 1_MG-2023]|uniref:S9 family peptidase n=1 Tax=Psychrobium sp. 1_MG-2023 TaxID=3062624 RepID=UPI000C348909|nr:S9 family peptidase [Psychrobium sp. 1_MG-2023]MDP2559800.1 S9 family peptidase [Psychrobium sp. 1_MG-2023]PKF59093.1 oligopeptidase B [Alteromonadales bacterium alter-6D02]